MSLRRGAEWGRPAAGPPDRDVHGDDRALARWVLESPGALIRFTPSPRSDLARALGLQPGTTPAGSHDAALDALALPDGDLAVNMVVVGTPPDRVGRFTRRREVRVTVDDRTVFDGKATTVVVAIGEFLRGYDVVPRGHPGDGRCETQVYRLRPPERAEMRRRLPNGTHVPHPRIREQQGRRVEIEGAEELAYEVDGTARSPLRALSLEVRPGAYRLLL